MNHNQLVAQVCSRLRTNGSATNDIESAVLATAPLLPEAERSVVVRRVHAELSGFGVLQEFLDLPTVREVMVNHAGELWVDRHGGLEFIGPIEPLSIEAFIDRALATLARRLDLVNPIVDARLRDGSRLCAVIPPVAPRGICLSIRKFAIEPIRIESFTDRSGVQLLREIIHSRCNVVVSGATSSGKTTLLNALTEILPENERIITIEDTAELQPRAAHVVALECRPGNAEGIPEVDTTDLLRAALRMRPDRLVIGEIRGDEAVELLEAMNTGHDGTLATCHANSAEDALRRIESLVMRATNWPAEVVRDHIRSSVDVVVHVARGATGSRGIAHIAEVDREQRGNIRTRTLWADCQQIAPLRTSRA